MDAQQRINKIAQINRECLKLAKSLQAASVVILAIYPGEERGKWDCIDAGRFPKKASEFYLEMSQAHALIEAHINHPGTPTKS